MGHRIIREARSAAARAPSRSFFDFVVADRPIYIPGSGPPVPEPTLMPAHDKDGVILRKIPLDMGHAKYVVTYEDKPYLKICVDEINVLDYVSARTYENFNHEEYHEILRKENEDPRTKAKNERRRQEEDGARPARVKPRKKRKKNFGPRTKAPATKAGAMGPPDLPVRRRTSEVEEEPKLAFKSPQRPSHSSPASKHMGLAQTIHDSDSDDDGEEKEINKTRDAQAQLSEQFENYFLYENSDFDDTLATEAGLNLQLQGFGANIRPVKPKAGPSRLSQQHNALSISESSSISPVPTPKPLKIQQPAPILPPGRIKRETSSRPSTSSSSQSNIDAHYRSKRQRHRASASASISSIEASKTYAKLTQNDNFASASSQKPRVESIHSRYSSSQPQTRPKGIFTTKPPSVSSSPITLAQEPTSSTSSDDDEIGEDEYFVDCILADKWTKDKNHNPIQSFLIKWEGYPKSQATWETEDNLSEKLIADYNATKSQPQTHFRWQPIVDTDISPEEDEKGKGKGREKVIPGATGDEDSLFLPGSGPGPGRRKSPYFVEDSRPSSRESRQGRKMVSFSADEDELMD